MEQDKGKNGYVEHTISNPFDAPFYYIRSTTSTMDDAKFFARTGSVHGTVVCTGFQTKGRGRFSDREWISSPGENLLLTIVFKKSALLFPFTCLPVITGLVLCLVFEEQFCFSPMIKWPNDILFKGKKLAGILCEAEKDDIFCGIGLNCNQTCFPEHLEKTAVSACAITGKTIDIFKLCESILLTMKRIFSLVVTPGGYNKELNPGRFFWQTETEKRLYRKGDRVRINFPGNDKRDSIPGQDILYGLDHDGALLVLEYGAETPVRIIAGEIEYL